LTTIEQEIDRIVKIASDIEKYRRMLEENPATYVRFPEEIRSIMEIAELAVEKDDVNFQYVPTDLRSNLELATMAVEENPSNYTWVNSEIMGDPALIRIAIEGDPENYAWVPDEYKDDLELAQFAVEAHPDNYVYAPDWIQKNVNLTKYAVSRSPQLYEMIPNEIKEIQEFSLWALKLDTSLDMTIPDSLRENKSFMTEVIGINPGYIRQAPVLQDDDKLALDLLYKEPTIFQYLSERLRSDETVIEHALAVGDNFRYVSELPEESREFLLRMLEKHPDILSYIPNHIDLEVEEARRAVRRAPESFGAVASKFKGDLKFCIEMIDKDPSNYQWVPDELKMNLELTFDVVKRNPLMFAQTPESLRSNRELAVIAVSEAAQNFIFTRGNLHDDTEIATLALREDPSLFEFVSHRLKDNLEFAKWAVMQYTFNLKWASSRVREILTTESFTETHKDPEGIPITDRTPHSLYELVRFLKKRDLETATWKHIEELDLSDDKFINNLVREYNQIHISPKVKKFIDSLENKDLPKSEMQKQVKHYRGQLNSDFKIPVDFILESKSYSSESIEPKTIKQPSPYKKNKEEAEEDLLDIDTPGLKEAITEFRQKILNGSSIKHTIWTGDQKIFKKVNHVMLLVIPAEDIPKFLLNIFEGSLKNALSDSTHPLLKGNLTIGWVRYTLGKDITENPDNEDVWIDEIQTDFSDIFGKNNTAQIFPVDKLSYLLLKKFIKFIRSRGLEKIYIPSLGMATGLYHRGETLKSPYTTIPPKLRFKKEILENFHKKVDDQKVWVLAKKRHTNLDTGYTFKP